MHSKAQLLGLAAALTCGLAMAAGAPATASPTLQVSKADDLGAIRVQLYRGAVAPFETLVLATPDDCGAQLDLQLDWSSKRNQVRLRLRGREALTPYPGVERTAGVDYLPNAHVPQPEDVLAGSYQLWIFGAAGPVLSFYYDADSYALLGGGPGFTAPDDAIELRFPSIYGFGSPKFQPRANGDVDLRWSFPYDGPYRGDRPEFSYHALAFVPPSLCEYDPWRIDRSSLRTWISEPLPRAQARPWSDYVRGGLLFEVTVEPESYAGLPSKTTIATYSGATAIAGGVPRGWTLDWLATLGGWAPPIRPWSGAGQCQDQLIAPQVGADTCTPG